MQHRSHIHTLKVLNHLKQSTLIITAFVLSAHNVLHFHSMFPVTFLHMMIILLHLPLEVLIALIFTGYAINLLADCGIAFKYLRDLNRRMNRSYLEKPHLNDTVKCCE